MHPDELSEQYRNIGRLTEYVEEHDLLKTVAIYAEAYVEGLLANKGFVTVTTLHNALVELIEWEKKNGRR